MSINPEVLQRALQTVVDPNTGKDFVSTKALRNLQISGGDVAFEVELGYPARSQWPELRRALIAAAKGVPGVCLTVSAPGSAQPGRKVNAPSASTVRPVSSSASSRTSLWP